MRVMGLDLSTTSTGLIVLQSYSSGPVTKSLEAEVLIKSNPGEGGSLKRAERISDGVLETVQTFAPDFTVIEGYSHSSKWSQAVTVELGTVVRLMLNACAVHWVVVPPSSLKKFVTGKGNSPKSVMIAEVYKRWGYETSSDDMADAYGLACMGLALNGLLFSMTKFQSEAIHSLTL